MSGRNEILKKTKKEVGKNKMKQKQVILYKSTKEQNHDFLGQITNTCYFDALTGDFHCKKCHGVVNIDWPRKYAFCTRHGIIQ